MAIRSAALAPLCKLLAALGAFAATSAAGFTPSAEWAPKTFPVSFWCGPPDPYITPDRYRQVADAGFNVLMPPCEGPSTAERNHRILDTARAAGLKAFLQDDRMPMAITGTPDAQRRLDAIVADYARHPALGGYFIMDEPGASAFAGLAEVVAYLRKKDPAHPAFINLFPNYADAAQLGTTSYEQYVQQFIDAVHPFCVSYDHYGFLKSGDRPGFFENLRIVRQLATQRQIPFWQIVLCTQHGGYRPPNEAEKRWEAMQSLAYGATGVLYFTYWTPADHSFQWGDAIIHHDGTPTSQYAEVRKIAADVKAMGTYLLNAVPVTVFENGDIPPGGTAREQGTPVVFPGAGDVTTGLFRADTHLYVLFANRDYRSATETDVVLACGSNAPQRLDRATGKWTSVQAQKTEDGDQRTHLKLAAGDAELYRW